METKIQSFTDLITWQHAHKLALSIYKATDNFPDKEKFGLTDQIRRAAVSVSSNIAEGFSRLHSPEKRHFYYIAKGSLTEVQNQLLLARDIGYLSKEDFDQIADQTVSTSKLITGLLRAIKQL